MLLLNSVGIFSSTRSLYAARAFNIGGTIVWDLLGLKANLISAAVASGNSDHKSAMVPVTKGAATLVPHILIDFPPGARLVMLLPGALRPYILMDLPKFEVLIGLPVESHAVTGITHG